MKTSSAKAKGRRLQQKVATTLRDFFSWAESDARSLPMGAQGPDIWLSSVAQKDFPFVIECKNVEKLNVWKAWEQAKTHSELAPQGIRPLVAFSKNNEEVLVIVRLEDLLKW